MDKPERSRTQALGSRYELEEMLGHTVFVELRARIERSPVTPEADTSA